MRIICLFITSWAVGLAAYVGSLWLFYHQSISPGDLSSVLPWSLLAFAFAFFALYLPVMFGMRRLLRGVQPPWPFPLVAVLLGLIPATLILSFWGGDISSLFSPEASLFYTMCAAISLVVGFGFVFIYRSDGAI